MRRYVGTVVYRHILQVHLAPDHLPILCWKHAKVFSRFMLSSRVSHKRLPLKDIESRPKFIVLPDGSLHKFCVYGSCHKVDRGGRNLIRVFKVSEWKISAKAVLDYSILTRGVVAVAGSHDSPFSSKSSDFRKCWCYVGRASDFCCW